VYVRPILGKPEKPKIDRRTDLLRGG